MKLPFLLLATVLAPLAVLAADTSPRPLSPRERITTGHLRATQQARERFARERVELPELSAYQDYRAVIHVHAEDSDHTKGTRAQVLAAAKKTGVRVVLLTDHRGPRGETWHGLRDGVLFLAGSEDEDGKLRFPGFEADRTATTNGELKFLCHVEERLAAETKGFTGLEICNRHTDAKLDRSLEELLQSAAKDDVAWRRIVRDFEAYPDEMFAAGCDYRPEIFAKWDRELKKGPLTGIGANDAHQNTVVRGVTFDPYEVSFRNLSTHLLLRELTEAEVRRALRDGHCYVAHDWLCDPTGFAFGALNNFGVFPLGDKAPMAGTTRLLGLTPVPALQKLFLDGRLIAQTNGTNLTFTAKKPGTYRLEAWLRVAGEDRPWIYANPVRLEEHSIFNMQLPNAVEAPNVEARKHITYARGAERDEAKHRLDLYVPKGAAGAPVFLFIHGGAWRFGDRGLYPPLGHRFAKEGILTVIPSYRLAPKSPFPAQIEDTAAAFAWTVKHIAEHGGDTNRIFIGGHSAGGHLTALLTLHPGYLKAHGLSARLIRGVIALSGVYNLDIGDIQSSVFGKERAPRQDASPLFHIRPPAPPFFVTYCQWDYPTLPFQAKTFHAALLARGVVSELFFTPKEDHISEMLAMTHDADPTTRAVLEFIRKN